MRPYIVCPHILWLIRMFKEKKANKIKFIFNAKLTCFRAIPFAVTWHIHLENYSIKTKQTIERAKR